MEYVIITGSDNPVQALEGVKELLYGNKHSYLTEDQKVEGSQLVTHLRTISPISNELLEIINGTEEKPEPHVSMVLRSEYRSCK
tara:strand:+ start:69 stop:320 length:252 start_codon:yes stop_codon:yes gene_type:complete